MKLILDNIIFSLQDAGGISNYWHQIIKRITNHAEFKTYLFDDSIKSTNVFRKELNLSNFERLGKSPGLVGRYTNPKMSQLNEKAIFHSSYYRYSKNPKHINISTVHDFTYEHFFSGIQLYAHTNQKRKALIQSDGIICVSENTKRDMLHFFPELSKKEITVIPHGVGKQFYEIEKSDLKSEKYFDGRPFILYVGDRKAVYKNFNLTVKASKISGLPLAIIGGNSLSEREQTFINIHLKKENFIHFSGVSNETLNDFYNKALCLVYPSSYEGFGLPLLEAQSAGCPVIAINSSSIPEVVGESGILLEEESPTLIAEEIKKLLITEYRDNFVKKGRENVKRFTWRNTFERTLEFYNQLHSQINK
ncbi:glycosyltransferase family 1 protein [Maribacter stanieri]|uniref:glycosyltransferase family 4 protein n=1 Tax=Maribacter stanieri TaxID=440514 RepID=UPI0030DC60FD|tara:strand:+ start:26812 stop:27900 length:1089 start_codon:yes stop_codon:yes gene_type:complete